MRKLAAGEVTDEPVFQALTAWRAQAWRYPVAAQPCMYSAMTHLQKKAEDGDVFIGSGVMLMVGEFTPWYGKERVFQEELILRVPGEGPVNMRAVIRFLETEAQVRGCDYILAGNTSQDPRLTELYHRLGYKHITDILTKEIYG